MNIYNKTSPVIIIIVSLALCTILLSYISRGAFGVIDDYELASISDRFNKLDDNTIKNYFYIFKNTEAFHDNPSRFRPTYFALRIAKAISFGTNPSPYFALNAIYFVVTFTALGLAIGRFFPWYITTAFMVYVASLPFNPALWACLGPSEIDAFVFTALFMFGLSRLDRHWGFALACLSVFMAMGCKENFILLLPPLFFATVYGLSQKHIKKAWLLWLLAPLALSIPLVKFLLSVMTSYEKDIYEQSTTVTSLTSLLPAFFKSRSCKIAMACGLLFVAFGYILHKQKIVAIRKGIFQIAELNLAEYKALLLIMGSVFFLLLGNYFFYRGEPYLTSRYGMPYSLFTPLFILCAIFPFRFIGIDIYKRYKSIFVPFLLVCIITVGYTSISHNRAIIKKQIDIVSDFSSKLTESKKYKRIYLFNAEIMQLYEPYYGMKTYEQIIPLPPVSYLPFFRKPKSKHENKLQESLIKKSPQKLDDFHFDKDVILFEAGLTFRIIDHTLDKRAMKDLLFSYPDSAPHFSEGSVGFIESTTFHVPTDNSDICGFAITGPDIKKLNDWDVYVNDVHISITDITTIASIIYLPYTAEMRSKALHLQFPSITFAPKLPPTDYLMTLDSIEIVRSTSATCNAISSSN